MLATFTVLSSSRDLPEHSGWAEWDEGRAALIYPLILELEGNRGTDAPEVGSERTPVP